ncbi:ParB/RepB/Spo0J family partition protein [Ruegeria sediminis]|uniref:ParB/RepB/Spo0J family partition protein n=1 Tax=Ruegeria sediminis TaxID=2583820 RepID=A0ABY2WS27_9RHOB|nr:ParB/RepB/Spo0J family partition protein [Ruegeria sediminis]TMV02596.1 ParB/RepB/Spo0J family partition protein [Ruegeria sediminis]
MADIRNKIGMAAAIEAGVSGQSVSPPASHAKQSRISDRNRNAIAAQGIQEIDPNLILPWGPQDRLGVELTTVNNGGQGQAFDETVVELAASIKAAGGQQVPVLLRPSQDVPGHYEVIYGRRRILACRYLNQNVKALIRKMDDHEALQAKGLENASRINLSFYERARFAKEILKQGYSKAETYTALSISKNALSQFERVTNTIPDDLGDRIGPAPESGRPKWTALAVAIQEGVLTVKQAHTRLGELKPDVSSDKKLSHLLSSLRTEPDVMEPVKGVTIKTTAGGLSMKVSSKDDPEFANWLKSNISQVIQESRERFEKESAADEAGGS